MTSSSMEQQCCCCADRRGLPTNHHCSQNSYGTSPADGTMVRACLHGRAAQWRGALASSHVSCSWMSRRPGRREPREERERGEWGSQAAGHPNLLSSRVSCSNSSDRSLAWQPGSRSLRFTSASMPNPVQRRGRHKRAVRHLLVTTCYFLIAAGSGWQITQQPSRGWEETSDLAKKKKRGTYSVP